MDIPKTALASPAPEGSGAEHYRWDLVPLGLEALRRAGQVRVGCAAGLPRPSVGESVQEFGSSPEPCGQSGAPGARTERPPAARGRAGGGAGRRK